MDVPNTKFCSTCNRPVRYLLGYACWKCEIQPNYEKLDKQWIKKWNAKPKKYCPVCKSELPPLKRIYCTEWCSESVKNIKNFLKKRKRKK